MKQDIFEIAATINKILTGSGDSAKTIAAAVENLCENVSAERAFVLRYVEMSETFSLVATCGFDPKSYRRLEGKLSSNVLLEAFNKQTVSVFQAADNESLQFDENFATNVVVPIMLADKSIGLMVLQFPLKKYSAALAPLLTLVASMIGQCLRIESSVNGDRQKLLDENSHLKQELKDRHTFAHIIGNSGPMKIVFDQVTQVARSNATVLLRGESGTGKEMVAAAIHYNSLRSKRPLIKVNCAALPENLIESELFGHEKGAFTGADRLKRGRFELAEGGTLFLDEIGDIPLQTQVKLLRVLQEREFERVGGTETIKANIRIVTATNRNLEQAIANGEFREDLYYRLNVFSIFLPALRERKPDILLLAEHFIEKYEKEHHKHIRRISTPAIDMLMSYHFPGNVRELENAIERAVLVCDSNVIHAQHLPPTLQTAEVSGTATNLSLTAAVESFERNLIADTLKSTGGNIAKAARMLDSTERILGYKIKKYTISPARFRK